MSIDQVRLGIFAVSILAQAGFLQSVRASELSDFDEWGGSRSSRKIPIDSIRPNTGFGFSATGGNIGPAFTVIRNQGSLDRNGVSVDESANTYQLDFEYQPRLFQAAGVFGVGGSFTAYSVANETTNAVGERFPSSLVFAWAPGVTVQYQALFSSSQVIVPIVGIDADFLQYRLRSGSMNHLNLWGTRMGLMFGLHALDSSKAEKLFQDSGISRTFVSLEYQMLNGANSELKTKRSGWFIGIRMEM